MIVSVNWLKKFVDIDGSIDELATLIGARLVEIESVSDLGAKYADVIVAKVVECENLEGSDHLHVTKIDDGGKVADVERDSNGLVQVVCGAPNIAAGQTVAWLPPKTVVPETFNSTEQFILGARKMLGVTSNGMIASARELDLYDDHTGIVVLDDSLAAGSSFAEALELNDYLLDIENKSLTHRPDAFGVVGFAREIAGIQGRAFQAPDYLRDLEPKFDGDSSVVAPVVKIDDPTLADRYQAIVLAGANEGAQSPLSIQTYLARVGVRPISAVVDVTNYLMLETGQPLHAFDYDKLVKMAGGKAEIHVRAGRAGEKLELLDGRTIELSTEDIVIAAGETAVGLAGAMGGASTEIDANTKNIIIESATFNLYKLRATQMRHGIFSEAITRFTKGQPAALTAPVLAEAVRLMNKHAGTHAVSAVAEDYPGKRQAPTVELPLAQINNVLGTGFSLNEVRQTLTNVEFKVDGDEQKLAVTAPYWRADIHIAEDVIEEVGRLNGFDNIAPTLPVRDFEAVEPSDYDQLRSKLRQILLLGGANEVLTYSFIHGDEMKKALQDPANAYRVTNSISPDLQYYRQSLTPSLLGLIHANIKQGFDEFALYEINKIHLKSDGLTDEDVPVERGSLALVVARKKATAGAAYYFAKHYADLLFDKLNIQVVYEPLTEGDAISAPFEPRRSATVKTLDGELLGVVGEFKRSVQTAFKLPEYAAGFELDTAGLLQVVGAAKFNYQPISRYPGTERDICFQVSSDVNYQQVVDAAQTALDKVNLDTNLIPLDIYKPENDTVKNITLRISLTSHKATLTGEAVNAVIKQVADYVVATLGVKVI